jgi:hypothetical protein
MPNFKGEPVAPVAAPADAQNKERDPNDPEVKQIMERGKKYETVLMNILHGKKTRDQVIEVLKSNPDPYITVPQAAMTVNDMGVMTMKRGGIDVEPGVQLVASQLLLNDLFELGQASEAFELQEGDIEAIIEDTFQSYVERGLKDKSIDPIQLQLETQQIMTDEQAAAGAVMGHGSVPMQPDRRAVMEHEVQSRVHQEREKDGAKQAKQQAVQKRDELTALAVEQKMQGGK